MADIARRRSAAPMGSVFGDIFGFDPLRLMNQPDLFGLEMRRTDNGYEIDMPVAGFRPEDVSITIEDDILTVTGQNDRRRFTRSMTLPDDVDEDRIEARVEHGLLTLYLPLSPKAQPRRIAVHVGDSSQTVSDGSKTVTQSNGGTQAASSSS